MFSNPGTPNRQTNLTLTGPIPLDLREAAVANNESDLKVRTKKIANEVLKEFCAESTVHGVRYMAEAKWHWLERVWWAIAFTASVIGCTVAILSIWSKWNQYPVVVTFDDKTTSIGSIPFPAVTICPTQMKGKIDIEKFNMICASDDVASLLPALTTEEVNQLNAITQACDMFIPFYEPYPVIQTSQSIYETMKAIAPQMQDIISYPYWNLPSVPGFKPIFTEGGLCYTLNSINSREIYSTEITPDLLTVYGNPNATHWNVEDGYRANIEGRAVYPNRMSQSGLKYANLRMKLRTFLGDSQICYETEPGFRLSLHAPDELPRMQSDFIHIPPGQAVKIFVKPKMITTSNGLRSYAPHVRGCVFKSERRLRFFKSYSQQKCEAECVANYSMGRSNCSAFYQPRDEATRVCTMIDSNEFDILNFDEILRECDCLPDCTVISFDVETSQGPSQYATTADELIESVNELGLTGAQSIVQIAFKENKFIAMKRTETSTMSDFFASCGGLLGLFMGISVLSIAELIYFFTLRLWFKLRTPKIVPVVSKPRVRRLRFSLTKSQRKMQLAHIRRRKLLRKTKPRRLNSFGTIYF